MLPNAGASPKDRHSWSFLPSAAPKKERRPSSDESASTVSAHESQNQRTEVKQQKSAQDLFFEELQQQLCERVADVMLQKARARRGTEKVFDSAYREGCFYQVMEHVSQLQPRYVDHTPEEVLRHMYMISSVRRETKTFDVLVTERPGESLDSTRQFSIYVVAVDRTKLLEDITEAVSSLGHIAATDAMTTKDGIAFDNFLLHLPDNIKCEKKMIKSTLSSALQDKIGIQPKVTARPKKISSSTDGTAAVALKTPLEENAHSFSAASSVPDMHGSKSVLGALGIPSPRTQMYPSTPSSICAPKGGRSLPSTSFEGVVFKANIQGSVYDATYKNMRVAAKILLEGDAQQRELGIVAKLHNPHIVTFIESIKSGEHHCMLFEFMERGSLTSLLKNSKNIPFFKISEGITAGMTYLHEKSIIHR